MIAGRELMRQAIQLAEEEAAKRKSIAAMRRLECLLEIEVNPDHAEWWQAHFHEKYRAEWGKRR